MVSPSSPERGSDPCLPIQVDLSAMLDGELDPASVRRVMVHSDVCPSCRAFLDGIRSQVRLHRKVAMATVPPEVDGGEAHAPHEAVTAGARLRDELTANRLRLAKILYELGRGFVLMGLSADFSRVVAKEPVPVPDMAMRGRNLVDEATRAGDQGPEWVAAKDLFDGCIRTADENLGRGQRLLTECLSLDGTCHESRIYLGLVHHVRGQRALARRQFQTILAESSDSLVRAYALSNLSNVHLDEGDFDEAVRLLLELVASDALEKQPRIGTAMFNLGLAYGLKGQFSESLRWFGRLHEEMPHRRNYVASELGRRSQFLFLVRSHPEAKDLANALQEWFLAAS
ncbi:MAG: tetratricopeptide repeat protein [Planctomycetes bacterium]|nr:tetratricopeptide repeat protein [Planctomycetota bacterium]